MHEVLVNRLGGLSLPRKSVVRLTDRPDMTLNVYRGRKTTIQQQQLNQQKGPNAKVCKKCKKLSNIEMKNFSSLVSLTCHFTKFVFLEQVTAMPLFNMLNMLCFFSKQSS